MGPCVEQRGIYAAQPPGRHEIQEINHSHKSYKAGGHMHFQMLLLHTYSIQMLLGSNTYAGAVKNRVRSPGAKEQ